MQLRNSVNDARAVSDLLASAGFSVDIQLEVTQHAFREAIQRFGGNIERSGTKLAVFYYARHGVQLDWRNYLLPVDAEVSTGDELKARCAISMNWKEVTGELYGAVDSLETQVEQMKGMFPDDDDLIQEALDEASDATRPYMAARKAEQAAQDVPASKLELTPSQVTIARKYADGVFAYVLECPTHEAFSGCAGSVRRHALQVSDDRNVEGGRLPVSRGHDEGSRIGDW